MCDYDDFYDEELSEADEFIAELKDRLKKEIKSDFLGRMRSLEQENEKLRDVRDRWNEVRRDLEKEKALCRKEVETFKKAIAEESLYKLLELFSKPMWTVFKVLQEKPKCDKCNEKREIVYTSAYGDTVTRYCSCKEWEHRYRPNPIKFFAVDKSGYLHWGYYDLEDGKIMIRNGELMLDVAPEEYSKLSDKPLFSTEEKAQAYADWKNEREQRK